MQRRKFLQSSLAATAGLAINIKPATAGDQPPTQKEVYEWREYEIRFGADQSQLENYFKTALIPALNKYGVKTVGVFKEWSPSEPARYFLLVPYPSLDSYLFINAKVKADTDYVKNSAVYNNIPADKALYSRFSASLMTAFDGWPAIVIPAGKSRIFELRTYEGYSEDAVRRKVKMFHDGEFPIFKRAKLNPVFCGEVIAGDKLPRLTYMVTCNSMEEREKAWAAFVADPEWKRLVSDPQYVNTISTIRSTFLVPTSYSQV
ncbi:NIPSNAP family protein [Chitinophaga pendula]|uniref:NIPSNAP family protein n=1 Tax=Chitinophaga TaxID=79328 RepID=UPI000BB03EC0|nr:MULTISPECIES: NIPSNAP family protein [Chitinophaga]ASZ14058.1 NIPSNAP family containing protein [Chitinophaga sp. MD30]UCJ08310.1 NIPSNAP family protein [Chitinophaga pendula]